MVSFLLIIRSSLFSGVAFLFLGGEKRISEHWMHYGAWIDYAKETNALLFNLEHRYYGESQPTPNLSLRNMKYLNSKQAVRDAINFIEGMNRKYGSLIWIGFGVSYSGLLIQRVFSERPDLLSGVVSSSAPVRAKADFFEYMADIQTSLREYSEDTDCYSKVSRMFYEIQNGIHEGKNIDKYINLCDSFDPQNTKDISTLFVSLSGLINRFVLSSRSRLCSEVSKGIYGISSLLQNLENQTCYNDEYKSLIDYLKQEEFSIHSKGVGYRQWVYQSCFEFGWFITSNQPPDFPFTNSFPLEHFIEICRDSFQVKSYNSLELEKIVSETNKEIRRLPFQLKSTLSVYGTKDPWRELGDFNNSSIIIREMKHGEDFAPPLPTDAPNLVIIRKKIKEFILKIIDSVKIFDY